jgi:hypothetical protein
MRNLLFILSLVAVLGCKKKYHCVCSVATGSSQGVGYTNQTQYTVKEWNEQKAHDKCIDEYGKSEHFSSTSTATTSATGIRCDVY